MGKGNTCVQQKREQKSNHYENQQIQTNWVIIGLENNNPIDIHQNQQKQENINENLILNEELVAIENVLAPAQEKVQKPIKLSGMQRAVRKMGLATKEQKDEYKAFLRQEEQFNKQENERFMKRIANKIKNYMERKKQQGNAFDEKTNRLSKNNPFLAKIQKQGDEDDKELDKYEAGRKALTRYKAETNGQDLDYGPMNTLLRKKKFTNKFKGNQKTCKDIYNKNHNKLNAKNIDINAQKFIMRELQSECSDTVEATKNAIEALNHFSLKEDIALSRHTGLGALASMLGLKNSASALDIVSRLVSFGGKELIIKDNAFLSTTIFSDAAKSFQKNSPVHFEILGKKGTKAYNISRMHGMDEDGKKTDITSMQDAEQEMLLQAGTELRVYHVDIRNSTKEEENRTKSKKIFTVYVETIPQEKEFK